MIRYRLPNGAVVTATEKKTVKEAFDELLVNLLTALGSWNTWLIILGMLASGYVAYTNQGSIVAAIIAALGVIGVPITGLVAKTYQKTHGFENGAPTVVVAPPASPPAVTPSAPPVAEPSAPVKPLNVRERISIARQLFGTWEGAKTLLLGTFKIRFEAALKRLLAINPNLSTIELARQAVLEVTGVAMDQKTCDMIASTPGWHGAVAANADIKIISDLLDAIDRTPALSYMKTAFTKRAVWYGVLAIIDELSVRVYIGGEVGKQALREFGQSEYAVNKAQFGGGVTYIFWSPYPDDINTYKLRAFDPYFLAKVDPVTLEAV